MTIQVDLLPSEKKGMGFDPAYIFIPAILIVVGLLCMMWSNSIKENIAQTKNDIEIVKKETEKLSAQLKKIDILNREKASLQRQLKLIQGLVNDPLRYANLLQEISVILPGNVWIGNLSIDPGANSVSIKGNAAEAGGHLPLNTVAQLLRDINDSDYFNNATLSSTQEQDKDGLRSFDFQIGLQYDPNTAASQAPQGLGQ